MSKRFFLHFSLTLFMFLILNNFIFDPPKNKTNNNLLEGNLSDYISTVEMKDENDEKVCSCVLISDSLITLAEGSLPEILLKDNQKFHLIKKNTLGISLYSEKFSPSIQIANKLEEGQKFIIATNLTDKKPIFTQATFFSKHIEFESKHPENSGIAITEDTNGLSLIGFWDSSKQQLVKAEDLEGFTSFLSRNSSNWSNEPEKYYCIENQYTQIVFSSYGGAISEINLKLNSKENRTPVLPVNIDKIIESKSPPNNRYPLQKTLVADNNGTTSYLTISNGGYMPLIRRNLLDNKANIIVKIPPENYALSFRGTENLSVSSFSVSKFTDRSIEFKGRVNGKEVTRSYTIIDNAPYTLEMKNSINGNISNLQISSGIPESELDSSTQPSLLYYNYNGKKMKLKSIKFPSDSINENDIKPEWTANTNGFFATILNPIGNIEKKGLSIHKVSGEIAPTRLILLKNGQEHNLTDSPAGYEILTPYKSTLAPGVSNFFGGPLDKNVLSKVDAELTNKRNGLNPEFIQTISIRGMLRFITDPVNKFLNPILDFFHSITNSWGISIILLTISLKLLLLPFGIRTSKSTLKLKKLQPKLKSLQDKYKNDPQRLRMEIAMFYRNAGVSPISTFLPTLLQLPFMIGIYSLVNSKFALRGAPFINGWIDNLAAPDVVFSWGISFPIIGNQLHLLPIIGALLMYISQKITTQDQKDKRNMTDKEKEMQHFLPIMNVVFLFMFYNLASGLNIYFIVQSIFQFFQQKYINYKYMDKSSGIGIVKN